MAIIGNKGKLLGIRAQHFRGRYGQLVTINCMEIEATENTWLSVTTRYLGWDAYYRQDQGYGAYERSIVIPQKDKNDPSIFDWGVTRKKFNPDKIKPKEHFLIRIPREPLKPGTRFPPMVIPGQYNREFEVKGVSGGGVGIGIVAGQVFTIMIRNPHTSDQATYTYSGLGVGGGIGLVTPSGWNKVQIEPIKPGEKIDKPVEVKNFAGPGSVTSVGIGRSGSVFVFDDPKVKMVMEGWEIQVGGQADIIGYWHPR